MNLYRLVPLLLLWKSLHRYQLAIDALSHLAAIHAFAFYRFAAACASQKFETDKYRRYDELFVDVHMLLCATVLSFY
eukprot:IDg15653t1